MNIALHSLLFPHPKSILSREVLTEIKEMGYQGLELIPIDYTISEIEILKQISDEIKLSILLGWSLQAEHNLIDTDTNRMDAGIKHMEYLIDCAVILESPVVAGLNYAGCGCLTGKAPNKIEFSQAVKAYQKISDYALEKNVTLCLEPATREDSHLINTVAQGLSFINNVNRSNVRLLLDTYQMLREERSIDEAIRDANNHIGYFHISESHRGTLGTGTVPWKEVVNALNEINYKGWFCVEAFFDINSFITPFAKVWRQLDDNPFVLARSAMNFIRSIFVINNL